jgi:hypothetical protein
VPFRVDPALTAAVDRQCRAFFQGRPVLPAQQPHVEARGGGFVLAFYLDDQASHICGEMRFGEDGQVDPPFGGSFGAGVGGAGVGPSEVRVLTGNGFGPGNERTLDASWVLGEAGRGIVEVQVTLADQPTALASRHGAWFVAAWAGGGRWPAQAVGFDASGQEVAHDTYP